MTPIGILDALLVLAVVGAGLVAAVWALRRAGALLPFARRGRLRFGRIVPLLEVALTAAAIIAVATLLLDERPTAFAGVLVALAAILTAASWFAVRDVIAGAVLRVEESFEPNQWIRVGETEGRIRKVGPRTLGIEREDGAHVRIPYTRLAGAALVRSGRTEDPSGHTFSIDLPPDRPPVRVIPLIRAAARNCFFVSATRDPHVHVTASAHGHRYDVTVFTLDRIFVPEIEAAVRRSLESALGTPAANA